MTKDKRNPTKWTNAEIQHDAEGYVSAQQAYREDQVEETRKAREQDDLERFVTNFVESGGTREGAEQAFWRQRNETAADAAQRANDEAATASRQRIRSAL